MADQTGNPKSRFEQQILQKAASDPQFRQELISNPKQAAQRELGISLPSNLQVRVVEEGANEVVLVLPSGGAGGAASDQALQSAAAASSTWGPKCESC